MESIKRGKIYARPRVELGEIVPLSTPLSLEVDVCSLCNLQCKFCFHNNKEQLKKYGFQERNMDFELFQKIIMQSKGFDKKLRKLKLSFFGEPLLNPELPKMIDLAKKENVAECIELTTNGIGLIPQISSKLVEAGLDRINISINGLNNEDYIKNCRRNIDVVELQKKIEFLYTVKNNCWIYIKLGDTGYTEIEKKQFYEMFDGICDEIYIENILDDAFKDAHAQGKWNVDEVGAYNQKIVEKNVCTFLFSRMMVNSEGKVCACCVDWKASETIGDLNKENIVEVWRGEKLRRLQILHLQGRKDEIEICRGCEALSAFTIDNMDTYAKEVLERMK